MDIYIKPVDKTLVVGRRLIYLKDIAEVYAGGESQAGIENLIVLKIKDEKKASYLISVMDVIRAITRLMPNATVSNVGETDVVVEYQPKPQKINKPWLYTKIAFVFLVLLTGVCTTIMCFHSDGQIPRIFENLYFIFFGKSSDMPIIMTIPYSIGLGLGIIMFFNHFSKFYITKDPTPIEVEMSTYEKETIASMVDALNKRSKEKL